ncbi:hypothetical protein [Massilia sp. 9096]|uniref:hypothetical protein n=1 Tax=Massilia sp. 9096 TaxID=1500894 RepID=UPI0012E04881|nr:hypothetical protein [Massilia sp. 9096]
MLKHALLSCFKTFLFDYVRKGLIHEYARIITDLRRINIRQAPADRIFANAALGFRVKPNKKRLLLTEQALLFRRSDHPAEFDQNLKTTPTL